MIVVVVVRQLALVRVEARAKHRLDVLGRVALQRLLVAIDRRERAAVVFGHREAPNRLTSLREARVPL